MGSRVKDIDAKFFTPRDYQLELLNRAVHHNTICSLGTGAGKTFIAVLLIKEYSYHILQYDQKAIFLVDKVALVEQQALHIECHCSLSVGRMHGKLNTGWKNKEEFTAFSNKHNVIVATAQVFLDLLNHAFFDITQAAVIIFDECHHSLGRRHPYRLILDQYRVLPMEKRCRILGLTASVLNKRVLLPRLQMTFNRLERIMCSYLEPVNDLTTMLKYGAKPLQIVAVCYNDHLKDLKTRNILNRLLKFVNNNCEFRSEMDVDPRPPIREAINRTFSVLDQVGSWCAWKVCIAWQKRITKFIEDPSLGPKQKRFLNAAETAFRTCTKILGDQVHGVRSYEKLLPFVNNRMKRLLEILRPYEPNTRSKSTVKDPLFGLVFVEQRYVAYVINVLLKMLAKWEPKEFGFIKADFVVGHSGTLVDTDEANAAHKRQESVLQKFRNGTLNLLVCTSVLEEGIDVRQCNLVVRYDPPTDFRSFVQSRGRARKENGTYCILTSEKERWRIDEELRVYAQVEEFILKRYKCEDSPVIMDGIMENIDEIIPPYVVESTKARVSMSNAISLINRYCSKLPSDVFTRLVPQIKAYPVFEGPRLLGYQAELVFPINSPVKEIITLGHPASTKAHALMAVALKGCQKLHERNELNDHLLPMGKDTVANLLSELDDEDLPYISMKTGSVKREDFMTERMSKHVLDTLPQPNVPCYVYLIDMKLTKPISEEGNPKKRRILDPSQVDSAFGFLSTKNIPSVPNFPVFQRQGEMEVHIQKTNSMISLTEDDIYLVQLFHIHVFEDILRVARGGVEFAPEHSPIPLLVVPLKRVRSIVDGCCVEEYQLDHKNLSLTIREPPTTPSDEVRQHFKFDEAKFYDAVVMPWYRPNLPNTYYYVAEICRDQNPSTGFPDEKFSSFNQYFMAKYQLKIYDQQQNLLDVDHTSARMNLLLPRISSSRSTKKHLDPSQRQVLVPELVHIHPLSSPLWTMLIALPTVMYRMNSLLLADELRCRVMSEAFGIESEIPKNFVWDKLEYTTINSENNQQPIKNLDHLKRIISAEKEKEQSPSKSSLNVSMHSENGEDEDRMDTDSFCIGVWDPEDAVEFQNPDPILNSNGAQPMGDEAISESIAMGSNYSIHNFAEMSDEEDEEAYDILLDLKMTMHEKLAHLKEPFEPREVVGWDGELNNSKFEIENVQFPLAISGNSNEINVASLMKDLETNLGRNAFESSAGTKNEYSTSGPERRTQRKKMYLDSMEAMDDADKLPHHKQKEETVDLTEFDEVDSQDGAMLETNQEGHSLGLLEGLQIVRDETLPESFILSEFINTKFAVSAPELGWMKFSFEDEFLDKNPFGVSPSLLLQALTTSSAADGINLERLETIGDSFLKLAVTNYLYHMHVDQHEGKLSFARSKEVSNSRLFNLGKRRKIPFLMEASKFDPHVNWLPPCYASTTEFHALNPVELDETDEQGNSFNDNSSLTPRKDNEHSGTGWGEVNNGTENYKCEDGVEVITFSQNTKTEGSDLPPLPYNMLTQQYVSDKSIADCVEALIGAHLVALGPRAALKFMSWLGVKVLTETPPFFQPLLRFIDTEAEPDRSQRQLYKLYIQFKLDQVEEAIDYRFGNKAYLLQAFTHASYYKNQITGCYQRLEFLGDAVLDYLITRFLFEHEKQYSPGVLTDLRSALVNNTIFASLAVKFNFHKHFIAICPGLYHMIEKFVNLCNFKTGPNDHCTNFDDEMFMITEDEIDEGHEEDIEVPKALGDIFESIAGAVYLDCGMNLDIVWRVFYNLMKDSIQECCKNPPQSPVRELFERKNCKARFTKLERILETGKVRVTVDVNDMRFVGMGRSYRIAKCTAAKRALKHLRALDYAKGLNKK